MKNFIKLPTLIAATGAMLMVGCLSTPENEATVQSQEVPTVDSEQGFRVLESMGFSKNQIVEKEDGYIVEGDMFFSREMLAEPRPLQKSSHRSLTAVTKAASLRLLIHSSISSYNTVIQQSVNNWNALKTRVHIEIVPSGTADITIYSDASASCPSGLRNLGSTTLGMAWVGSTVAGNAICMNMDQTSMLGSERLRVAAVTHEIGHSLAFWHTNGTEGKFISGTATSDPSSVMNSSIVASQCNFTHEDILATEILYPSDKPLGGTDLDGDKKDDIVVWRPSDGKWFALRSNTNFTSSYFWQWGQRGDMPMADMDMDADGIDDKVVWRPSTGTWHCVLSANGAVRSIPWGQLGDIPLSNHDMDGDAKDDLVVWRWTEGKFFVLTSKSNYTSSMWYGWGTTGDQPVSGIDADKDGKDDLVFWRATEGKFYIEYSATNFTTAAWFGWGQTGDIPMGSTDLDRDTKDDLMVWRPADGKWYARTSSSNFASNLNKQWGVRGDVPVIGTDIDQDGKKDLVIWRPSNATWRIAKSSSNFTTEVSYVWGQ